MSRTDNCGEWPFVPSELMADLVSGEKSLDNEYLQSTMMDWLESKDYNHFKNLNGTDIFSLVCKRGNIVYATRKSVKMDGMIELLNRGEFDYPIGSSGLYRMSRILFVTVNFDKKRFTKEEAWASLRSVPIEGAEHKYGFINNLDANLSKIFGTHGKLVCRESQEDGYPAPHMLLILDKPVRIKFHKGQMGDSWRIDEHVGGLEFNHTLSISRTSPETDGLTMYLKTDGLLNKHNWNNESKLLIESYAKRKEDINLLAMFNKIHKDEGSLIAWLVSKLKEKHDLELKEFEKYCRLSNTGKIFVTCNGANLEISMVQKQNDS